MRSMRFIALAALFACGGDRREPHAPIVPNRVVPIDAPAPDDGGPAAAAPAATPGGVPHLALIAAGAIARHADAALSIDAVGEVRLWTALDGSVPPRRVGAGGLLEARVERAGDRILVGGVLPGGLGYLGLHDAGGAPPAETTLDSMDGDVIAVVPTVDATGAFVARADQSLELRAADGARLARVTLGRERVRGLAPAGPSSVVAVLRQADDRYVARRYHRRGDAMGADRDVVLPRAPRDGGPIAVSPDGRRLAFLSDVATAPPPLTVDGEPPSLPPPPPPGANVMIVDLTSGADATPPKLLERTLAAPAHLGFSAAQRLHVDDGSGGVLIVTLAAGGELATTVDTGLGILAVADDVVLGAHGASLAVRKVGGAPLYLGYRVLQPRAAELSPDGRQLAISTYGQTIVVETLDGSAPDRLLEPPGTRSSFVAFLDAQRLIVVDDASRLSVRDAATGAELQSITVPASHTFALHPRRGWMFGARGPGGFWAVPVDPSAPAPLGKPVEVDDRSHFVVAVDGPAGGPVVATLDGTSVRTYTAADLADRAAAARAKKKKPATSPMVSTGDDLGHFYGARGTIVEVSDLAGKTTTIDVHTVPSFIWPLPGGGVMVASEAAIGVTAYGLDGARRWSLGVGPGMNSVSASADRSLLALLAPGGLHVVDAATGEPRHLRCAWGFGAWDSPPNVGAPGVAPHCR